ncbi:unnamed protein product [Dovyalis caffra]|uniref:Uncharacterized protein n=1 Tax=Dovyalis caffra TaxID=77055 RepID=A0AAV1RAI1_9ROSI|nr:unnamed protein product [Dovyalis caffra]
MAGLRAIFEGHVGSELEHSCGHSRLGLDGIASLGLDTVTIISLLVYCLDPAA